MFQRKVIQKYLSKIDKELLTEKYALYCSVFANKEKQENIRNSKEEQYQDGFIRDLFCSVLGYTIKPEVNYNILTELKNESKSNSKKSDGAIIINNKVKAVIELKGADTQDLDKVAFQAFSYKNHHEKCDYVIISNFERLRLYVETQIKYEEFNLFNLSKDDFNLLYLLLQLDNITNDIPLKLKYETLTEEKEITNNFYADYSTFKKALFKDLIENNREIDKLLLFKKTQKLLDRILFILFCEDRNLLPTNSTIGIINDYKKLKELGYYQPLYNVFKTFFDRIDKGFKHDSDNSKDVFAYNGGLFKPDETLNSIKVSDDVLYIYSQKLSNYDFQSQISVDILGRIFENSLTEIEEVQNQIENERNGIKTQNANIGKRKKDGVFYTPEYITKYIVENTIGKLCEAKKEELKINDKEYTFDKKYQRKTIYQLDERLNKYRDWLLSLKILDCACGSGAFLNAALNGLRKEHTLIDYFWSKIHKNELNFSQIDNTILENNLYGVDINEDSIEITKLSLWLHTATRNRKLTTLNDKIKCGNSLIDDEATAGKKAFNWKKEFPEVFEKGGFDIVISNPPYVRRTQLDNKQKNEIEKKYFSAYKQYDLYVIFNELAISLVKENGLIGLIQPNKFLSAEYGLYISNYINKNCSIESIKNVSLDNAFSDASVYPYIFIYKKISQTREIEIENISLLDKAKVLIDFKTINDSKNIINKVKEKSKQLKDLTKFIKRGLPNSKIDFVEKSDIEAIKSTYLSNSYCFPVEKLFIEYKDSKEREGKIKEFSQDLILLPRTILKIRAIKHNKETHILDRIYYFDIESNIIDFVLAILNSKLTTYVYNVIYGSTKIGGGYIDLKGSQIKTFYIPETAPEQQKPLVELSEKMLSLNKDLQKKTNRFISRIKETYNIKKITQNIESFYNLSFADFVKELTKQKIKISMKQKDELEDYFNEYVKDIQALNETIEKTDKEINTLVYLLYNLTNEEIKIIERG